MRLLATILLALLLVPAVSAAVDPTTVDAACNPVVDPYDPAVHGAYDATSQVRFCTPWRGTDLQTGAEVDIDDVTFELISCDIEAAGTGSTLVTAPFPGFGKLTAMTAPAQFIQEHPVDLVCYLGRKDGQPIDSVSGEATLKGEAANAVMRFRLATLPAGVLLQP